MGGYPDLCGGGGSGGRGMADLRSLGNGVLDMRWWERRRVLVVSGGWATVEG